MRLRKTLRKWGNGYGIAISKAEAKALGVTAGDAVEADLVGQAPMTVADLPFYAGTSKALAGASVRELYEEALMDRYVRKVDDGER